MRRRMRGPMLPQGSRFSIAASGFRLRTDDDDPAAEADRGPAAGVLEQGGERGLRMGRELGLVRPAASLRLDLRVESVVLSDARRGGVPRLLGAVAQHEA